MSGLSRSGIFRFNSQPRKGADIVTTGYNGEMLVSTHSPARGLTSCYMDHTLMDICFNSQPRKGADVADPY